MNKFSSVSRLKLIVEKFNEVHQESRASEAFANVFDYEKGDPLIAYEYSIEYFNLVEKVVITLSEASSNFPFIEKSIEKIESLKKIALYFTNTNAWRHCVNYPKDSTLLALETVEGFYEMYNENIEFCVDDDYMDKFKDQIDDLYQSVSSSDLPRELRLKIFDCLIDIKKSLLKYQVSGIDGIEKSMSTLFGCVGLNKEVVNEETQPQVFGKVKVVFNSFKSLVEMSNSLLKLPSNAQSALSSLSNLSDNIK